VSAQAAGGGAKQERNPADPAAASESVVRDFLQSREGVKRRCVFLDRDGTVNVGPGPGEYVRHWPEFHFIPGIVDWIRIFNAQGFLVIVVTNQRGVARGLIRPQDLDEIHRRMAEEIEDAGGHIDQILCCPHDEDSCDCRKPKPGLVLQAQLRWDIDLASSLLIGDCDSDRELARACGMSFVRVRDGRVVETIAAS
jgi:D-glycero-D-manno-heptose 1,7-bisphosphate phosphatase